jgi:hypothetical protein
MAKEIKDKERDSIDFGKTRIEPLFNSIFYPTLLSMVFATFLATFRKHPAFKSIT